jgi:hypothetical protein
MYTMHNPLDDKLITKSSRIKGRLSSVESSESAERFQRDAARASCIQKPSFLWKSDGISKYQYALQTKNCRCKRSFFLHGSVDLVGFCLLSEFPRLHSDMPHSLGSLQSRDRPVPEISTCQHTKNARHTSMFRRYSNIQTQQASGRGPSL